MVSNNRFYGWRYRLEAFVSGYSTSSEFLTFVTIPWRSGMRADFRDLRFITEKGKECAYYSESIINFTELFVCVKLPANTKKFWVYYGNGGVKSKSNGSDVFTFFDDFTSLNTSVWTATGAGITVSNSILQLINTSTSCYLESKTTYPVNSLVEMRLAHQSGQRGPYGFRSNATNRAAAWQGAAGSLLTDQRFSHNGSSGAWHDDGVNRSGAYHVYGVVHIATAPRYYVDYALRGTNTDIYPGSANLPIHFYCYSNQGYIKVDWVRIRPYQATEPVVTLGRKYLNAVNEKTYPWDQAITGITTNLGINCGVELKTYLADISTTIGLDLTVLFRHPQFYIPPIVGPYPRWRYKGNIRYETQDWNPAIITNCDSVTGWSYYYGSTARGTISLIDKFINCDSLTGWSYYYGSTARGITTLNPDSVQLTVTEGGGTIYIGQNMSLDLSNYHEITYYVKGPAGRSGGIALYCPDNSNRYRKITGITYTGEIQKISIPISSMSTDGSPDLTNVTYIRFEILNAISGDTLNIYSNPETSIQLSVTTGGGTIYIGKSVSLNLSHSNNITFYIKGPAGRAGGVALYCPDNSNRYRKITGITYTGEIQKISIPISSMSIDGSPDLTNVTYVRFEILNTITGDVLNIYNISTDYPARLRLKKSPGMFADGRDLRFASKRGKKLSYNIFDTTDTYFDIWVELPESEKIINYFWGNGAAKAESNSSLIGFINYATITHVDPYQVPYSKPSFYYPAWKGEGIITLTGVSSTGEEQILITIKKVPGMSEDGRDLRFTYPDGKTQLGHYIESVTSTEFLVWVRLPINKNKIKFYYGNPLAVSESSGENTFYFFDDFEGSALDSSKWTLVQGSATVANSCVTLGHTTLNTLMYSHANSYGTGYRVELNMRHDTGNQSMVGWGNSNATLRALWLGAMGASNYDYAHTYDGSNTTSLTNNIDRSGSTFYQYDVLRYSSYVKYYVNAVTKHTVSTTLPSGNLNVLFYSEVNSGDVVVDWVRVRKPVNITGEVTRYRHRAPDIQYYTETWTEDVEVIPTISISHQAQAEALQTAYEFIRPDVPPKLGLQITDPTLIERRILADYSTGTITVEKDIENAYSQLKTQFYYDPLPPEDSSIKHVVEDSFGNDCLVFAGKILPSTAKMGKDNQITTITAVDHGVNLATQVIPWTYQVVDTENVSIPTWIERLIDYEHTGVYLNTAIDTNKDPYQFIFDVKTKRLEAIKTIAEYAGCMYTTKLKQYINGHFTVIRPEFYFVPPEQIDDTSNGFDLPDPVILENPGSTILAGSTLLDEPEIEKNSEDRYNKVTVYGTLSDSGDTVVASAFSYEVYTGATQAREYIIEDNTITEKGSTVEREAIKWLLYFLAPRVTVTMQFANRFDLELYQRIKFGAGFPQRLTELTNSVQVSQVALTDPTDENNPVNLIDVSGVPRPSWLRISGLTYTSKNPIELVKVKAVTDYIYSNSDPIIRAPYSNYLGPGYYKPNTDDSYSNTQSIVEDTIEKQLTPESCTVLSINTEEKTAVVQTASGKIVTVSLA